MPIMIQPRAVLLDLDGTVYVDGTLVAGADVAVARLRAAGIGVRFVTNTTRMARSQIAALLGELGVPAAAADVFAPPRVAAEWLRQNGVSRVAACLPAGALAELEGLLIVEDRPEAVVIGDLGSEWTFERMNQAFRWIREGARLVALHRNPYWKSGGALLLDVGAFVAAFEYATGRTATLVGKPSRALFEAAARSLGLRLSELAMVGDDPTTDVAGARACGLPSVLVRTGRSAVAAPAAASADLVIDSIAELPSWLLEPGSRS
jgi:HAD superfamily hydrolase (TIGR01458 family)